MFSTIEGAIRACKYRGPKAIYILKNSEGKFYYTADNYGVANVGDIMPDMPKWTVVRIC